MSTANLRAIAIQKHKEALAGARFWNTRIRYADGYGIRGACRADAAKHLDRAAAARYVYVNAEAIANA